MRSLLSIVRAGTADSITDLIRLYEADCDPGPDSLVPFWNASNESRLDPVSTLTALIKVDLQRRFDRGERPRVAEYLERFPQLKSEKASVVSLVYEEFCLLDDSGEGPDSQEFCETYSPWRDSLTQQFAYHRDLGHSWDLDPHSSPFPALGSQFDKYKLIRILGSGAVARVYLATEDELAGRKVVLKVSESFGREPTILATLNHRNIVPILTYARSDSGLCGICMPYRPGITLEEMIRRLGRGQPPRKARAFWDLLQLTVDDLDLVADPQRFGWDDFPIDRTFADAVAWIGLQLAQALEYLHSHKIYHRDIKPANILLAYREGPQLLDFNLAQDPGALENVRASARGGTLPYMAPEHLQAFLDHAAWEGVCCSADLYSLGLVLRELVTGRAPELPEPRSSVLRSIQEMIQIRSQPSCPAREINPLIPPSFDSIIAKCLQIDSKERYASATELAEDLRRFLDRRPLEHAENSSTVERGANWLFRNRLLVALILCAGVGLLAFLLMRTPDSIPDRSDFKRAVMQLDSSTESDWNQARKTFEDLHREFPRSAWSTLYLALTLEKIDKNHPDLANLVKDALEQPDAEPALRSRLARQPNSAKLLTSYGLVLMNLRRFDESRTQFQFALNSEPDHLNTLMGLIKLERKTDHDNEVVRLTPRAVAVAKRLDLDDKKIYAIRNMMVPSLVRLAEQTLEQGKTPDQRLRALSYLESIEETLDAMLVDIQDLSPGEETDIYRYTDEYYRGFVASVRGFLASEFLLFERAKLDFDSADGHFKNALDKISTKHAEAKNFRDPVLRRQQSLKTLRDQWRQAQERVGLPSN
jgi:serine/threonine protein kinase